VGSYPQKNMALQRAGHPKIWRSSAQVVQKYGAPARRSSKNMALKRAGRPKIWRPSAQVIQKYGAPARRSGQIWRSSAQVNFASPCIEMSYGEFFLLILLT
jgi:hypothetical protein